MRIFITGYGMLSSLGNDPNAAFSSLLESKSAVRLIPEWQAREGMNCQLGAPVIPYDKSVLPRIARRTMSPMSEMAAIATKQALQSANIELASVDPERTLISMGSTTGSPQTMEEYFNKLAAQGNPLSQSGTAFFKVMNHSVASNVAVALGFNGAVLSPSSACATSAHAAIIAWEQMRSGLYDLAIVGGADELHYLTSVVFDSVYAASKGFHSEPENAPRPFDKRRDGLVVSEGASVIILESEQHLKKRQGQAIAEFLSGAYLCESSHMSQSNSQQMVKVMNQALKRAGLINQDIDYVSAHATGTLQGDGQEAMAIREVFGSEVPVSSLKGHFGHSMAACGVGEIIMSLKMIESGTLIGTRNLEEVADDCLGVNHLMRNIKLDVKNILSNNFAFGGINTSVIFKGL